ncbi:MAG: sugar transferase [Bacteroidia bacterium]|nr:sugar transferase [Bacteroidia bacterium]
MKEALLKDIQPEVRKFLSKYADLKSSATRVLITTTAFNVENLEEHSSQAIINLKKINDIRFVNKFQEAINERLPIGGVYAGFVETQEQRKYRLLKKFMPGLAHLYFVFDFIFKRVFPKLPFFKKLYFFVTNGRNRVMSKAEALGRLASCGFKIIEVKEIGNYTYFVGKKERQPYFDLSPSYGPLFTMNRIGKDGKMIQVYKFRTMYPYAEYLQEYIYEQNKLASGGKFAEDFRITSWGKFMRKCWLDELPMVMNVLKGDIKIVGVRPLSKHYYSLYTKELQEKRIYSKPGLLPPFYVDMPSTLDEIIESELKYLRAYEKRPVLTDIRYFFSICTNIIFRKVRSN